MVTLLLLHIPPGVTSLNVVNVPSQTLAIPVIADGTVFTLTVVVVLQPDPRE
jgi:hypothetical protein